MPFRTQSDLIVEVLSNIGILAEGQTPQVEDTERVANKISAVLAMLTGLGIAYIMDVNNIPDRMFSALADIVAYECRNIYAITGAEAAELLTSSEAAKVTLRTLNSNAPSYLPLQVATF